MVPIGAEGCTTVGTKPYELMYFWFAVGVNAVWVIVPLLMLCHAVRCNADMRARDADMRARDAAASAQKRKTR